MFDHPVKKYIRQYIALGIAIEELNKLSNTSLEELFKSYPPVSNEKLETLKAYFPEMEKALKRKGITRERLWKKYISEHPDGYRISMFKEHYNRWRKQSVGIMHIVEKTEGLTTSSRFLLTHLRSRCSVSYIGCHIPAKGGQ